MTVAEIIEGLNKVPQDAEPIFLCPDGYADTVDCIEYVDGNVEMMGYIDYMRKKRTTKS